MLRLSLLALLGLAILAGCASDPTAPVATPDVITFVARHPVTRISTVYRMNADGSELRALGPIGTPTAPRIAVTMEGRYVFFSGKNGSDLPLMRFDVGANTVTPLGTVTAAFPTPSPDGTRMVFFEVMSGGYALVLVNADGSGRTVLADASTPGLSLRVTAPPAWSPSSDRIVVCGVDTAVGSQDRTVPFVVSVTDRTVTRVPPPTSVPAANWVSPTTLIYLVQQGSGARIRTFDVTAGTESDLGIDIPSVSSPFLSVSPDRSAVVCANPLTIVDLTTKQTTLIGSVDAVLHDAMWSRNSASFAYADRPAAGTSGDRLVHRSRRGEVLPLPGVDSLGISSSVVFIR